MKVDLVKLKFKLVESISYLTSKEAFIFYKKHQHTHLASINAELRKANALTANVVHFLATFVRVLTRTSS